MSETLSRPLSPAPPGPVSDPALLGALLDGLGVAAGIVEVDAATGRGARFRYVNALLAESAGRTPAALLGQSPRLLLDSAPGPDPLRPVAEAMAGGRRFKLALWLAGRTGGSHLVEVEGWPLAPPAGGCRLFGLALRQVALHAGEGHLRDAVEALNDGFLLLDPSRRVVLHNRRFLEIYPALQGVPLTGMTMEALTLLSVERGIFPAAKGREEAFIAERLRHLRAPSGSLEHEMAGGRWVRISETRTADGWTVSLRSDITGEKEAERRLREGELRFRTLAEASPAGIFQTDLSGQLQYANPALARLTQMDPATLMARGWRSGIHPEDLRMVTDTMRRAAVQGTGFAFQARVAGRWVSVLAAPHRDVAGRPVGFIGTATDIHARREAEAALQASERRYRKIIETAQEGILAGDQDNVITLVNQRMADMMGYAPEELAGKHVNLILFPEEHARVVEKQRNRRRGQSEQYDLCFRRKDGTGVWALVSSTPTTDAAGHYAGSLAMVVDLTHRREAELALARHVEELEESRRQLQELAARYEQEKLRAEESALTKARFLSSMSHELRTPLNSILGFSDMLRDPETGPSDPTLLGYAEDIHRAGAYLLELINDILDMSKIEAGKYELRVAPVATYRLIGDTVRLMRKHAADAGLALVEELAPDLPERVRVDGRAVRQVLLNLLSNAIKFTHRGGRVTIRAVAAAGRLELTVEDTGIGIPPDHLPRLCRPFEQVDSALNRRHQGSGLGLALCKALAEMHGGQLSIDSEPGRGTSVHVLLPLKV